MKYKKCPRCGLNYITQEQELCKVCADELEGKRSIFDDEPDGFLCPYCEKNMMGIEDVMCAECLKKRKHSSSER